MRHHNHNRKLGRKRKERRALLKALGVSLVMKEKIRTTEAKAKELRPYVERLITYAKNDVLSSNREIISIIGLKAARKLVKDIAPKYKDRKGGYLRITKLGVKKSDASPRAQIEWV